MYLVRAMYNMCALHNYTQVTEICYFEIWVTRKPATLLLEKIKLLACVQNGKFKCFYLADMTSPVFLTDDYNGYDHASRIEYNICLHGTISIGYKV